MYALYQVLHVQPVEQFSVLVGRWIVKIVRVHWVVDRQLAYGWLFFLPQEWVWLQGPHIVIQPYPSVSVSQHQQERQRHHRQRPWELQRASRSSGNTTVITNDIFDQRALQEPGQVRMQAAHRPMNGNIGGTYWVLLFKSSGTQWHFLRTN